jgi:hypothetical protein
VQTVSKEVPKPKMDLQNTKNQAFEVGVAKASSMLSAEVIVIFPILGKRDRCGPDF